MIPGEHQERAAVKALPDKRKELIAKYAKSALESQPFVDF
jgi:hypothetical protein